MHMLHVHELNLFYTMQIIFAIVIVFVYFFLLQLITLLHVIVILDATFQLRCFNVVRFTYIRMCRTSFTDWRLYKDCYWTN